MEATNPTDESSNESLAEKRARWEHLRMAACPGVGKVNVENVSYGVKAKKDHTHTVSVESGIAFDCTCADWKYNNPPKGCKHMIRVGNAPDVMTEAQPDLVTDGGHVDTNDDIDDRFRLPEDPKHVEEPGTVELSRCKACSKLTTHEFCSDECERRGDINEESL